MLAPLFDRLEERGYDRIRSRDALRRASQTAISGVLAWLAIGALPLTGTFVAVLAAVLIVQPSADGTFRSAVSRISATVLGCAVGSACLLLLPDGWNAVVGLAIALALLNAIATFRPDWTYGVVAAVALATTEGQEVWVAALDRTASIALGAAIGIAVSAVLWRDRAGRRFDRHMAAVLVALSQAASQTAGKSGSDEPEVGIDAIPTVRRRMGLAQEALDVLAADERETRRRRLDAARDLLGAIEFLNRVTASEERLTDEPALREAIGRFRDAVADIARDPAQEIGIDGDLHDGPVTRAQRQVTRCAESGKTGHRRRATVLAFAMDEIDRALIELHRACAD
ncbi:FUSC family protein [Jannaschia formosa]|uniref:FUSC family protein n=1 Tax=Jannaschia formosa TaxID=2259592 RepID=UPI000E1BC34C|nr:FUSC family protein [Jannaschia formosa]TFL18999.1 FUSC family protein [Jannaschia formosa]